MHCGPAHRRRVHDYVRPFPPVRTGPRAGPARPARLQAEARNGSAQPDSETTNRPFRRRSARECHLLPPSPTQSPLRRSSSEKHQARAPAVWLYMTLVNHRRLLACGFPAHRPNGSEYRQQAQAGYLASFVHTLRIFEHRISDLPLSFLRSTGQLTKETAFPSGMAGHAALLLDGKQYYISVAIQAQRTNPLSIARLFALAPEALARPRPINRLAGVRRFQQGIAVHPGHHQDPAALPVLGDGRHQAIGIEYDFIYPVH